MQRLGSSLLLGFGLLFVSHSADAHDPRSDQGRRGRDGGWHRDDADRGYRGNRGNDRYGNGSYGNRQYGYSQDPGRLVSRVMQDLNRAAMNSRADGHEQNHFRQAMERLSDFQARWEGGRWDQGRLDRAIEDISHLVSADQVRGRDREILAQDLASLRRLRANQGAYGNGGYSPYGSRW